MAATAGPRYAPEDPTLPKPWKGLVDGRTGNLYFWNPDTNVTQYERPVVAASYAGSAPVKSSLPYISSSGQVQQRKQIIDNEDNGHTYGRISDGGMSQKIAVGGSDALVGAGSNGGNESIGGFMGAEAYRRHHEITVSGDDVPAPFMCFEISSFPSEILREVCVAGFSAPTPIQAQSWPIALQGRDIGAVAKTGSGKTLGYLVPGFMHIKQSCNNSQMGPTVLVLSPTRELATQIVKEVVKFGSSSRISCTCLYGGTPKVSQLRDLEKGADIVVATPGRLNDIMEMGRVSLQQVSYLVLDEADRMLDMGFEPQIRKIVKEVPTCHQTLMFTATWPKEVRRIAADLLVKPVQVNIGNVDELVANKSITQYVEVLSPMDKQRRLEQILRSQEPGSKIIVFCATKKMCDNIAYRLTHRFGAACHDKSQTERDHVLNQFRNGRSPVLVATDVATRGLDVKDIRVVINYDFPTGVEDYVHRIGRTGRAGATGLGYTFFSVQDAKYASDLIKILEGANQKVPPEIRDVAGHVVALGKPRRCSYGPRGQDGSGSGRCDSGYSGWGGWSSSAGADRGGRGANFDTGDRYDHGNYSQKRGRSRSRSRSRSPSPRKETRQLLPCI